MKTIEILSKQNGVVSYVIRASLPSKLTSKYPTQEFIERSGTIEDAPLPKLKNALEKLQRSLQKELNDTEIWRGEGLSYDGTTWSDEVKQ